METRGTGSLTGAADDDLDDRRGEKRRWEGVWSGHGGSFEIIKVQTPNGCRSYGNRGQNISWNLISKISISGSGRRSHGG